MKNMKTRVVVAMSGGVDSSVAAWLLQRQGYEVIGITMCFGLKESNKKRPSCCGIEGIEDAQRVAQKLGIRHYVLNFDQVLEEKVIKNFISEYLLGKTPNPCVRCNEYLKFEQLLNKAKGLDAKYLATGHYARIEQDGEKIFHLKKANDRFKDQSYFLYRLRQKQMAHILMPLGNLTKERVRKLASDSGLAVADKPGSQDICFIPSEDYRDFIRHACLPAGRDIKPGLILDTKGNILGKHRGIPFYTIGQREGLGIAMGYPVYVVKIDAKNNSLIVGKKEEVFSNGLIASDISFTDKPEGNGLASHSQSHKPLKREVVLSVKIRYNHKGIRSRVIPLSKNRIKIIFSRPQFAVTPGQSAVLYQNKEVIAGGIIEKGLSYAEAH